MKRALSCIAFVLGCLWALGACYLPKPPKTEIAAALDGNTAEMQAFRRFAKSREEAIVSRCEAEHVTPDACEARVNRFRSVVDEAVKLYAGQGRTLKLTLAVCTDGGAQ